MIGCDSQPAVCGSERTSGLRTNTSPPTQDRSQIGLDPVPATLPNHLQSPGYIFFIASRESLVTTPYAAAEGPAIDSACIVLAR